MSILDPDVNPEQGFQAPCIRILVQIATKLPSFQSPAAAKAVLRTPVMQEPYL